MFQGTFDPFTVGHADLVKRALDIFDEVVVAVVNNVSKSPLLTPEQRAEYIKSVFAGEPRVSVVRSGALTVDVAKQCGATCLLRGVRNAADLNYEQSMAQANRELGGLDTVLLLAKPEHAHISSSLVRELRKFNQDVSRYVPLPLPEGFDLPF